MRGRVLLSVFALGLTACQPRAEQVVADTPAPALPPAPEAIPGTPIPAPRLEVVSVAELVRTPERYAGREVALSGTCLGGSGPALGGPPRTRSDWQIGSKDAAVWVAGPFPTGCTRGSGGGYATVHGRVDTDLIPGGSGQKVRAYLVARR